MSELKRHQIHSVVKQVLTEILTKEGLVEHSAAVGTPRTPTVTSRLPAKAVRPSRRKLADENNSRWLGHEPTRHQAARSLGHSLAHNGLPALTPHEEVGEYREKFRGEEKNLIPNARRPEKLDAAIEENPARVGVWRAGTRYLTKVALKFRADHAVAKDAVAAELKPGFAEENGWTSLETKTKKKEEYLLRPDLGRQLDEKSLQIVREKGIKNPDVQITVADGLSAWAAERYAASMVRELVKLCQAQGYSVGTIFCVRYARIAIQDVIGEAVGAKVSLILLGERPGLGTGDSLSNYMVYGPKVGTVNANKSMISNIHPAGHAPEEAARLTLFMLQKMFEQRCSGVNLKV